MMTDNPVSDPYSKPPPQRLLHRFYESIVLLRVLEPTRGDASRLTSTEAELDGSHGLWHRTLDDLAWTCDFDTGGDSVSAVAAESRPAGPKYWVASYQKSIRKAVPHFKEILEQLGRCYGLSNEELLRNEVTLKTACIKFSKKKALNYAHRMGKYIHRTAELLHEGDHELRSVLAELISVKEDMIQLCDKAYDLRRSSAMQLLQQKIDTRAENESFKMLRHYIGRLGSWNKAAKRLIEAAIRWPQRFHGCEVDTVVAPSRNFAPNIRGKSTIDGALGRMIQSSKPQLLEQLREIMKESPIQFSEQFRTVYSDLSSKPRVHAELLLLEHFFHGDLDFLDNERYIGCSKPSCYCCELYMKWHPANYTLRPCHGNLWVNWQVPLAPISDDGKRQAHAAEALNDMRKTICKDVVAQILSRRLQRPRKPDSSTGITASRLETTGPIQLRTGLIRENARLMNEPDSLVESSAVSFISDNETDASDHEEVVFRGRRRK